MNPSKNWKEIVPADEEKRFARFAEQLVELQRMHAVDGHVGRGSAQQAGWRLRSSP